MLNLHQSALQFRNEFFPADDTTGVVKIRTSAHNLAYESSFRVEGKEKNTTSSN